MRNNVNRTRRAGWRLQPEPQPSDAVWTEIEILGCPWLASRASAGLGAGPLTPAAPSPAPFFLARQEGPAVAFLACIPLGARGGWYLEDVVRASGAPGGTAALLVQEAIAALRKVRRALPWAARPSPT